MRRDSASAPRALDLLTCPGCGGARTVLAAVSDRDTIDAELAARGLTPRQRQRLVPLSHGPRRQAAFASAA